MTSLWSHAGMSRASSILSLVIFRLAGTHARFSRSPPGTTTFPPILSIVATASALHGRTSFPQTPFRCPRSRTATLALRSRSTSTHTWAWLYHEPSPFFVRTRPARDQVDSDSDARAKLTRIATTDRLSCPGWTAAHFTWILIVFTSVVCVISVPRVDHFPLRAARLPSLEVLTTPTGRYHGTKLIRPFCQLVPPKQQQFLRTRKFGTLTSPPPPVVDMPWWQHPPLHLVFSLLVASGWTYCNVSSE